MMKVLLAPRMLLAKAAAAVAIAVFWCITAVGTTVGVTTLVTAATSTTAEAHSRPYRHCHWRYGRKWCHGGYWRRGWGRGRGRGRWW